MEKAHTSSHSNIAALSCSIVDSSSNTLLHLLPAGAFRATHDDRPTDVDAWIITADLAQSIIDQFNSHKTDLVIDYEHQTLLRDKNGMPAPAAGWITALSWCEEKGLLANVEWTQSAKRMIESGEYRYVSPVFTYSNTGEITQLLHAALTNTPALDLLDEVSTALSKFFNKGDKNLMDLSTIIQLLGLPATASLADCIAAINQKQSLIEDQSSLLYSLRRVLSLADSAPLADIGTALSAIEKQLGDKTLVAALSAQTTTEPDPAKYVGIDVVSSLQNEIAALSAKIKEREEIETTSIVEAALSDGRLLPVQKEWALSLAQTNKAALTAYLGTVTPIAALTSTQTAVQPPASKGMAALTKEESDTIEMMGISKDDYLKQKGNQ